MTNTHEAIAAGNQRFGACIAAKDFVGLAGCYELNATLLPPGASAVIGQDAIGGFWEAAVTALGVTGATLTSTEIEENGDTANEFGEGILDLVSGQVKVKYLVVWKRQVDNGWLMHWDIWNETPAS
jgi:ketosteroid isomerase-like protein